MVSPLRDAVMEMMVDDILDPGPRRPIFTIKKKVDICKACTYKLDLAVWSAPQRDSCTPPPSHRAGNKNCYHTLNFEFPGISCVGVGNPETVTTR